MLLAPYVYFHILVKVTEWPPIGKIAAHSAYEMFSWYKYLIVSLVFPTSVFGVGIFFLIAPFPDLCLLVPFFPIFVGAVGSPGEEFMLDIGVASALICELSCRVVISDLSILAISMFGFTCTFIFAIGVAGPESDCETLSSPSRSRILISSISSM